MPRWTRQLQDLINGDRRSLQIEGEALDALSWFPDAFADLVFADPPYIIGGSSVGNPKNKSGTWADMVNAAHWFTSWFLDAQRILKPTGYLVVMGNWRSIPTLICGLAGAGLTAQSCLVWDKQWIGTASRRQLRRRYEIALFVAMPEAQIPDRSIPDIYGCKWHPAMMGQYGHPAEKPRELMHWLIRTLDLSDGVIVDPFMGSGTMGEAAAKSGQRFIGIEMDLGHFRVAKRRISEAETSENGTPEY